MVEEFYTLYNTLSSYKKSIVKNLDKIDEHLLQEFCDYGESGSRAMLAKKYTISKDMLGVLETYIKILFLSESAVGKLTKFDCDRPPERDESRRNSNPFHQSPFALRPDTAETILVKSEAESDDLISESDTIVEDCEAKSGPTHLNDDELPEESTAESIQVSPIATRDREEEQILQEVILETAPVKIEDEAIVETIEEEVIVETPMKIEEGVISETTQIEDMIPVKIEKETVSDMTPEEVSTTEASTPQLKYTALAKLLNMNVHDRRREAEKRYASKHVQKEFKWRTISKTPSSPEKRKASKCAIFEIEDDVLEFNQYCVFCHVQTPSAFYVRTNQELFESLENSLNEDLNNQYQYVIANYKSKQDAKATVGNFCFVYLTVRRKWYRVQVIDWMETEKEQILIQLIDYGDKFICKYENLKRMMELYSEFPKMAVKCHFASLYSPDDKDQHRWPQGSIDALIELSEMKQKSKFLTIHVHKEGDSYGVDLKKEESDKTLSEILIEHQLAVQEEISSHTLSAILEEEEEEIEEYNINEIVSGYDAQDEARICPFTDGSGRCFKGPSCKLEHSKLAADGITTDKALVLTQALTELVLPATGVNIEIVITGYVNTCHFYAHIVRERTGSNLYNDDFYKLIENMNSNNIVQTYEPFRIYPSMGEVVLVKHGQQWYRGTCIEHLPDNQIKVFMVDYGLYLFKKMTEIRQIKDDFLYLPFQAVECLLDSCREKVGASSTLSKEFYETCMQFKTFKAYVVNTGRPLGLKLYDEKNLDMDYVLKECGLGQDRDSSSFPKDCFLLLH